MNADDFVRFGGSLTADVLSFNTDAIPAPDTLFICMTRGESRIADELRKQFGGFRRVVIDVDGEQHEFSTDSLIRLLEGYEGARDTSRYGELFGTPERAARTSWYMLMCKHVECDTCVFGECDGKLRNSGAYLTVYDTLLEWLSGDA